MKPNTTYAVVDIETTGTSVKDGDRIIQIGCAFVKNNKIINTFATDVNPLTTVPAVIENLTGISNARVRKAPPFDDLAGTVYSLLQGTVFVAHNVNFDLPFINSELQRVGYPELPIQAVDTVSLSQILLPTASSFRLRDLSHLLAIDHNHPHSADSDAIATAQAVIENLTGISNARVRKAPPFDDLAGTVYSLLQGTVFVAHNVNFDLPFINSELQRVGYPELPIQAVDTVSLSQILLPTASSFRLRDLSHLLAIDHNHPHSADSDAIATAQAVIENLTGISNARVRKAPPFDDLAGTVYSLLQGTVFVAHNVNFDLPFINSELQRVGYPELPIQAVDTVSLSQILLPTTSGMRLWDFCRLLEIDHNHPHSADSDAIAT
ncbi:hypothetical protein WP50_34570, partial [Lactiplantibacillus plantarum]